MPTYDQGLSALSRQALNIIELGVDTPISPGGVEYLCEGEKPEGQLCWPCVDSIQWLPTRSGETGGLGYLGEVIIVCRDFAWPNGPGTYFGRLMANNPYLLNRELKIHVGFYERGESFSFANFQERLYFIKRVTKKIDSNGITKVTIEAADALSRLKESQAPKASNGNLSVAINESYTGLINIGDNIGFNALGGYAIVEDEIIRYSQTIGIDQINLVERGLGGTTVEEHDADAPIRHVYYFHSSAVPAINAYYASGKSLDCIRDLIENYTEIDHTSYINDLAWNDERDNFLSSENVEVWILEPMRLDKIIDKIGQQTYTDIWWDDEAQQIKAKAIGPTLTTSEQWNDDHHILDTKVIVRRNESKAFTQCWVYYGKIDQTGGDEADNFEYLHIRLDQNAETGLRESRIKKIFADYIPANGAATASRVAARFLSQNANPLDITLQVDAKDSGIKVGEPIDLFTDLLQGIDGLPELTKMRIIERAYAGNNRYTYRMVFSGIEQGNQYAVIAPDVVSDYDAAIDDDKLRYAWIADSANQLGVADDEPYLII